MADTTKKDADAKAQAGDAKAAEADAGATAARPEGAPESVPGVTATFGAVPGAASVGGAQFGDVRVGADAAGVATGNPYDPNTPPYSVYDDPTAAEDKRRQENARAAHAAMAEADGTIYRYDGPKHPNNGTKGIVTSYGTVYIGETVKLTDGEADHIRQIGHKLVKADG